MSIYPDSSKWDLGSLVYDLQGYTCLQPRCHEASKSLNIINPLQIYFDLSSRLSHLLLPMATRAPKHSGEEPQTTAG